MTSPGSQPAICQAARKPDHYLPTIQEVHNPHNNQPQVSRTWLITGSLPVPTPNLGPTRKSHICTCNQSPKMPHYSLAATASPGQQSPTGAHLEPPLLPPGSFLSSTCLWVTARMPVPTALLQPTQNECLCFSHLGSLHLFPQMFTCFGYFNHFQLFLELLS